MERGVVDDYVEVKRGRNRGNADDQALASAIWNQGNNSKEALFFYYGFPINGPAYIPITGVTPVAMAVSVFILAQSPQFRNQKLTPCYSLVSG